MERAVGVLGGLGFGLIWTCGDIVSHAMTGNPWAGTVHPVAYSVLLGVSALSGFLVGTVFKRVRQGSLTDPLTLVGNRRAFVEEAEAILSSASRRKHRLTIAIIDLDGFKAYNDTMGHPEGDALLRVVASRLGRQLRKPDAIFRYGGDEFTVIMPHTGIEAARGVMARMADTLFDIGVTFCAGMAEYPRNGTNLETLVRMADKDLYREKRRSKESGASGSHKRLAN